MIITYTLSEDDYLNHQLFVNSQNSFMKSQRVKIMAIWAIALAGLAFLFYDTQYRLLSYYFSAVVVIYLLFYSSFIKWSDKKHYLRHVREVYKNVFEKLQKVIINDTNLFIIEEGCEIKISNLEIEKIYETKEYIYLKMKSGMSLIIPKLKIESLDLLKEKLLSMADDLKIDYVEMLNGRVV